MSESKSSWAYPSCPAGWGTGQIGYGATQTAPTAQQQTPAAATPAAYGSQQASVSQAAAPTYGSQQYGSTGYGQQSAGGYGSRRPDLHSHGVWVRRPRRLQPQAMALSRLPLATARPSRLHPLRMDLSRELWGTEPPPNSQRHQLQVRGIDSSLMFRTACGNDADLICIIQLSDMSIPSHG